MNWEAISVVAELLGLIAVVISVLYLGLQVKNQTQEYKLAGIHDVCRNLMDSYTTLQDPVMAEAWLKGSTDYDALSDVQKIQVIAFITRHLRLVEDTYYQAKANRLKPTYWEGIIRFQKVVMSSDMAI
ncbi:MAG: hypothetical protein JKX92_15765 [Porticoccaceae bacterium]|nr:hypothetical protein [Porticoccaceae bacterium]